MNQRGNGRLTISRYTLHILHIQELVRVNSRYRTSANFERLFSRTAAQSIKLIPGYFRGTRIDPETQKFS